MGTNQSGAYQLGAEELGINTRHYIKQYAHQDDEECDCASPSLSMPIGSNSHQADNVAVETIEARSENPPTFYDFFSVQAMPNHDMKPGSASRDSTTREEGISLDLSLWNAKTTAFQEAVLERSSNASADRANNALAKEPLHVSACEELDTVRVNEPAPSVTQVIQSCADESHVSDSLEKEAHGAIKEVVEQNFDSDVNRDFQPMVADTLSEHLDYLRSNELDRTACPASRNSNPAGSSGCLESGLLEESDEISSGLMPRGAEIINSAEVDSRIERVACFDFFRCLPWLSIVLEWKKRREN